MFTSYSITGQSTYLSDIAVHLFLQTSLSVNEIQDKMTNGTDSGGELLEEYQSPSVHGGCTSLSRSCSAYEDHDSGFSYSTASSLNDCGKSLPFPFIQINLDQIRFYNLCSLSAFKSCQPKLFCLSTNSTFERIQQKCSKFLKGVSRVNYDLPFGKIQKYYLKKYNKTHCLSIHFTLSEYTYGHIEKVLFQAKTGRYRY